MIILFSSHTDRKLDVKTYWLILYKYHTRGCDILEAYILQYAASETNVKPMEAFSINFLLAFHYFSLFLIFLFLFVEDI